MSPIKKYNLTIGNCISGVMVSVLASSVVDRGFEHWSGQTNNHKIGIYCFSAKHTALRSKAQNQYNVQSEVTCLPVDHCFNELAL